MGYSEALRAQLRVRADAWAANHHLPCYHSLGSSPTVMFERLLDGSGHGNFHPASWQEIVARPPWAKRLEKAHPQQRALPPEKAASAKELDSSNSSDALLMNCFCYPTAAQGILRHLGLNIRDGDEPEFGWSARLGFVDGATDATEIDMKVGSLLCEAKLTEKSFTSRPKAHVLRYQHLLDIFDIDRLPSRDGEFLGYQVIRNMLAAGQHNAWSVVLVDVRRPDLREEWQRVHEALLNGELRDRCRSCNWQDVALGGPAGLTEFLGEKYGL